MTGSVSAQRKHKPNPMQGMTAAEKNAYLTAKALAPRGMHWNFTLTPTPSKKIHVAGNKFATV